MRNFVMQFIKVHDRMAEENTPPTQLAMHSPRLYGSTISSNFFASTY
jgi:hypothetical protein